MHEYQPFAACTMVNESGDLVPDTNCRSTASVMFTEAPKKKSTSVAITVGTSVAVLVVLILASVVLIATILMWRKHRFYEEKEVIKDIALSETYVPIYMYLLK